MTTATAVKASEAWIDPSGKFYAVPLHGHCNAAYELGDTTGGQALENAGWAHISYGSILTVKPLTQSQLNTLFDLLLAYEQAEWPHYETFKSAFERAFSRDA